MNKFRSLCFPLDGWIASLCSNTAVIVTVPGHFDVALLSPALSPAEEEKCIEKMIKLLFLWTLNYYFFIQYWLPCNKSISYNLVWRNAELLISDELYQHSLMRPPVLSDHFKNSFITASRCYYDISCLATIALDDQRPVFTGTREAMLPFLISLLVYTEFILVRLWRKRLAYRNSIESVPGTNQYWKISFLLKESTACPWQGFNPCS